MCNDTIADYYMDQMLADTEPVWEEQMPTQRVKVPKMKSIVIAPWQGDNKKMSYSLIGLGIDGFVYRYEGRNGPWLKLK